MTWWAWSLLSVLVVAWMLVGFVVSARWWGLELRPLLAEIQKQHPEDPMYAVDLILERPTVAYAIDAMLWPWLLAHMRATKGAQQS